jgi:hypothetical protein
MKTFSGRRLVVADLHASARSPGSLDAGEAGHADVEKDQFGPVLGNERHRLAAVLGLGHDLQFRPDLGQTRAQLLAHQALRRQQ